MTADVDVDGTNPDTNSPGQGEPDDVPTAAAARRTSTAGPITVGYDGSPRSFHVVSWAAQRAARTGDRLGVVSCYGARNLSEVWRRPQPGPLSRQDADELLEAARSSIWQRWPDLTPIVGVSANRPHDQLVNDTATSSLIVVGAPGTRRLDRWRIHPVTRAVVRRSRCPVVLVAGAEELPAKRRVLCGIDGSPASFAALRWAADEADDRGVELQIAHVWGHYYPIEFGPVRVTASFALITPRSSTPPPKGPASASRARSPTSSSRATPTTSCCSSPLTPTSSSSAPGGTRSRRPRTGSASGRCARQ